MARLCIISTIPTTVKVFFGDQLRFLQDNGFDITVITSSDGGNQDFGKALPEGVKLETVQMSRTIKPHADLKAFFKIHKIIRKNKFDIVQYVTPKAALFGAISSFLCRVPVRLYLMWGLCYVAQTGVKRFMFKRIERLVCKISTAIALDSRGNRRFATEEGLCKANKISVVGHGSANGVDIERFNPDKLADDGIQIRQELNISSDSIVLGCVAAIVRDKGINELIEAFAVVAKEYENVRLLYIGQTTEENFVRESTLQLMNSHEKIIHLCWKGDPERYMAAMDIFVLPTYREGLGVVNIEASAMKLPVISTDVPGPQESVVDGKTGLLVPAREVDPLVQAMRTLLDKPLYAKKLGEAGRQRVIEHYEQKELWENILEHRINLLSASKRR